MFSALQVFFAASLLDGMHPRPQKLQAAEKFEQKT
jgi:hypothetical protein